MNTPGLEGNGIIESVTLPGCITPFFDDSLELRNIGLIRNSRGADDVFFQKGGA